MLSQQTVRFGLLLSRTGETQSLNPKPLTLFFEPVKNDTQFKRLPSPLVTSVFTADFALIFVKSLAIPDKPCISITKSTEIETLQAKLSCVNAIKEAICKIKPTYKVNFSPSLAASQPAVKFAIAPAISYTKQR